MHTLGTSNSGYTYVELLLAVVVGGLLVLGLSGIVGNTLETRDAVVGKTDLNRSAAEAMRQMRHAALHSRRLLLPLVDNPATNWPENVREQTVPPSPPIGDSTLATAVFAVTLPEGTDRDADGSPDADNDGDGRIDEDPPGDNNHDGAAGLIGIDDNGDGSVDNSPDTLYDDDEDGALGDEGNNGLDDDGDGSVDEDLGPDLNRDGASGVAGVDDDGDGAIDEGDSNDDDEDGQVDEDWYDVRVFFLDSGVLKVRSAVPWDSNGDSAVDGSDSVESELLHNVTRFRVERVAVAGLRATLVDLLIEAADPVSGSVVSLRSRVRVGGAL
ncbi:MAG: hypothetical protein QNJ91_08260 [Gammaproteobacteria bacterium]|nr:hypothetical protein [Gammaproteobacteria bacterium]